MKILLCSLIGDDVFSSTKHFYNGQISTNFQLHTRKLNVCAQINYWARSKKCSSKTGQGGLCLGCNEMCICSVLKVVLLQILFEYCMQGVKARTLGRLNERNFGYDWLVLISIFGLCFMSVGLMKSNCYSFNIFFFG